MLAQGDAIPAPLQGLVLVRVDAALGVAVMRDAGGAYQSWHAGETVARNMNVTRLYADRVEVQVISEGRAMPRRYWLAVGAASPQAVDMQAPAQPAIVVPASSMSAPQQSMPPIPR